MKTLLLSFRPLFLSAVIKNKRGLLLFAVLFCFAANVSAAVKKNSEFIGRLNAGTHSGGVITTKPPAFSAAISSIILVTTSPTNAASVQYSVAFSAAVTGVATSNFSLTTTGVSGAGIASVSGSGAAYTVTVNTGTGDGSIVLNLANSTGISPSISTALPFAGRSYTIDKTAPSVNTLYQYSNNTNYAKAVVGDLITLDFSTNEPIQEPASVSIGGHTVVPAKNGVNTYRATYTMASGDVSGRVHFFVQFTDLAGNESPLFNDLGAGDDVEFSSTAPYATNVHFVSNNTDNTIANIGNRVTLTFTAGKAIKTPVVNIAGHAITPSNPSANNYSATYVMTSSDEAGTIVFNAILTDADDVTTIITNVTTSATVVFNSTPTVNTYGTLHMMSAVPGSPSASMQFKVSGYNLSGPISVQPPSGFEVSADNVNFGAIASIGSGLVVPQTLVYIRLAATDLSGTYGNNVLVYSNFSSVKDIAAPASTVAAQLKSLSLSSGTLSPAFKNTTGSYRAMVANSAASITVTATNADGVAPIKVNGADVVSGTASGTIPLSVGPNTITVLVTSQDNTVSKTYTVVVTRVGSSNAKLSALALSSGTLNPVFASATNGYTASVPNTVSSITVTPTTLESHATVKVNGATVAPGAASGNIPLAVGDNVITTVVTAQNGTTTNTYTVTVNRALSANATLASLHLSNGALNPSFAYTTTGYTATVGNTVASVTATAKVMESHATLKINGTTVTSNTPSGAIPLNIGPNTIAIDVTAQDGVSTQTYTVTVTRTASNNANLASLHLSNGALNPSFVYTTTDYTASVGNSVTSLTAMPRTMMDNETIKVNGTTVVTNTASQSIPLSVGPNTINVVVTAQDGVTVKTYTVTVTRATGSLSFTGGNGLGLADRAYLPNQPADDGIVVHQNLSPNGDGMGDVLTIDGITTYPENKLLIVNRAGVLVYEATGYNNVSRAFNGRSNKNGKMQLPGTYFYSLAYKINGLVKYKTGFIVLKY